MVFKLLSKGIVPEVAYHKLCSSCLEDFDVDLFEKRYVIHQALLVTLVQVNDRKGGKRSAGAKKTKSVFSEYSCVFVLITIATQYTAAW